MNGPLFLLCLGSAQAGTFLHYTFDDTFADASGSANDGTWVEDGVASGGFVDAPAAFGRALAHPEQDEEDRVAFTTPFTPDAATPWTIAFWHGMSGGATKPLGDHLGDGDSFQVRADAVNQAELKVGGVVVATWSTGAVVTQETFNHYAIVADPAGIPGVDADGDGWDDNVALYVDGALMTPDAGLALHLAATDIVVTNFGDGADWDDTFDNGHGTSDELWIFDGEALDADRIAWLRTLNDACDADVDADGVLDCDDPCPLDVLDDLDGDGVCDSDDVPTLAVSGACPGTVTLEVTGLLAGGKYGLYSSTGPGNAVAPSGPCTGMPLGLSPAGLTYHRPARTLDLAGNDVLTPTLGAGACGRSVQVLDFLTCQVTNVAEL